MARAPGEAGRRAMPGHGEGDLLAGKDRGGQRSAPWSIGPPAASCCCTCPQGATPTWPAGDAVGDHHPARRPGPHHHRGRGRRKGLPTPASSSRPASRSTATGRTSPGRAARTRTPTGCCASTCPKAPTCRCTPLGSSSHRGQLQQPPRKTLGFRKPWESPPGLLLIPPESALRIRMEEKNSR